MPSRRTLMASAAYATLAAADTVLAGRTSQAARRARFVLKPLLMPTLSAAFAEATRGRSDALTRSTRAAQALSWGGDVALLGGGDKAFLTGVGSFAGAHAAYITGFATRRDRGPLLSRPGLKVAAAMWVATAPVMAVAAARRNRDLGPPIAGYGTILAAMFATSTLLDPSIDATARRTLQAGAGLFLISDSLLGVQEFLLREHNAALESAVMATYTAGQGLLAAGVART